MNEEIDDTFTHKRKSALFCLCPYPPVDCSDFALRSVLRKCRRSKCSVATRNLKKTIK